MACSRKLQSIHDYYLVFIWKPSGVMRPKCTKGEKLYKSLHICETISPQTIITNIKILETLEYTVSNTHCNKIENPWRELQLNLVTA